MQASVGDDSVYATQQEVVLYYINLGIRKLEVHATALFIIRSTSEQRMGDKGIYFRMPLTRNMLDK